MPGEAPDRKERSAVAGQAMPGEPVYIREYAKQPAEPIAAEKPLFGYQNTAAVPAALPVLPATIEARRVEAAPIIHTAAQPPLNTLDQQHVVARPVFILRRIPIFQRQFYTQRVLPPAQRMYRSLGLNRFVNWIRANPGLATALAVSLLLLPIIASLMAGSGPMGYYNRGFGRMAFWRRGGADVHAAGPDTNVFVKVKTHGASAPIEHERSWSDWFFRREHADIKHKELSKTQTASQFGSILHAAKDSVGAVKDAASNIADKASDLADTTASKASRVWEDIKDKADTATGSMKDSMAATAAAAGNAGAGVWEKTKHAAEGVVDRIMHPSAEADIKSTTHETHHRVHQKPINVHVEVDHGDSSSTGFFGRLFGFFFNPLGSLLKMTPLAPLARLTPLGVLTTLGLLALPLYFLWNRRRVIAPAVAMRPQVVPVVRPVGYTVVQGAGTQNIPVQQPLAGKV